MGIVPIKDLLKRLLETFLTKKKAGLSPLNALIKNLIHIYLKKFLNRPNTPVWTISVVKNLTLFRVTSVLNYPNSQPKSTLFRKKATYLGQPLRATKFTHDNSLLRQNQITEILALIQC